MGFDIMPRKYRYMDSNLAQRRKGLEDKIPDIKKTLGMVEFLAERKGKEVSRSTTFELNETLYAEAELEDSDTVYLWLGVSRRFLFKVHLADYGRPTSCLLTHWTKQSSFCEQSVTLQSII